MSRRIERDRAGSTEGEKWSLGSVNRSAPTPITWAIFLARRFSIDPFHCTMV